MNDAPPDAAPPSPGTASRSRPRYPPLAWDETGRRHLLLVAACPPDDDTGLAALRHRLAATRPGTPLDLIASGPPDLAAAWAAALRPQQFERAAPHDWPDVLGRRLAEARMGLRLYLVADEDVLWRACHIARAAGLGESELRRHLADTAARPVWCAHCGHRHARVAADRLRCGGCGRRLGVREHFSRRLGAYLGVLVEDQD